MNSIKAFSPNSHQNVTVSRPCVKPDSSVSISQWDGVDLELVLRRCAVACCLFSSKKLAAQCAARWHVSASAGDYYADIYSFCCIPLPKASSQPMPPSNLYFYFFKILLSSRLHFLLCPPSLDVAFHLPAVIDLHCQ